MELVPFNSSPGPSRSVDKCQVCFQKAHGCHFGADTCRACAAFFRRFHMPKERQKRVRTLKCRQNTNDCKPHESGRWYCKKCRMARCDALGMKPDNIQLNRDLFSCSTNFGSRSVRRSVSKRIPQTVERVLAKPHVVLVLQRDIEARRRRNYVDLTYLVDIVADILRSPPAFEQKTLNMNTLERLTFGLKQLRSAQLMENVGRMQCIGKEETVGMWQNEIVAAAKWLMYCDEFRALSHNDKFTVVKCMWHLFNRFERIAMTAEMRVKKLCGPRQFVVSHNELLDFETSEIDVRWISDLSFEELTFFLGPLSSWFNDQLVNDFIDLQPSDVELTFMLCNLCFHLTGKKFNGSIENYTDNLQDVLANDLHSYYANTDVTCRYSHRLLRMLSVTKDYQKYMNQRQEKAYVGSVLQAFNIDFSHPEMFQYSC